MKAAVEALDCFLCLRCCCQMVIRARHHPQPANRRVKSAACAAWSHTTSSLSFAAGVFAQCPASQRGFCTSLVQASSVHSAHLHAVSQGSRCSSTLGPRRARRGGDSTWLQLGRLWHVLTVMHTGGKTPHLWSRSGETSGCLW